MVSSQSPSCQGLPKPLPHPFSPSSLSCHQDLLWIFCHFSDRNQRPLLGQAKQAGRETSMAVLEFYLLMFYFTGSLAWGKEVARIEAWPLMVQTVELSSKSLLAPRKSLLCFQGERRALDWKGCPLFTHTTPVGVSDTLGGQAETRTCPLTINLCK